MHLIVFIVICFGDFGICALGGSSFLGFIFLPYSVQCN
ncbi:putative membrane protein (plasmid) [Borreliella bissettiae DN127]|uniref:Membrane protein n=1 Tax=Borrelia bissettiae (strain DSM 17990 / CIP 109136 / DN127) TaxID=521010 RepID=G0AP30_BORBD|nr:putative membrane protein [Borreliella bissettiae DN127]